MHRIYLVDDHPLMRQGLALTIDTHPDFEVVGQAASAEEALENIDQKNPDVAILDISLPGMSGLELVKHLTAMRSQMPVLVVSRHDEALYAERVIRAGARGYVMKMEAGEVIVEALQKVISGGVYVSDEVHNRLLMGMLSGRKPGVLSPLDELSDRELEVFELTGQGHNTRVIAERLHLSVKTVESYRSRIKEKLNLSTATELMQRAVQYVETQK
ncbi:MAG: response regulator transcription factor [Rhodothermales bacterium]